MNDFAQRRGKLLQFPAPFWIAKPEPYVPTWRDRAEDFVERRTGLVVAAATAACFLSLEVTMLLAVSWWLH